MNFVMLKDIVDDDERQSRQNDNFSRIKLFIFHFNNNFSSYLTAVVAVCFIKSILFDACQTFSLNVLESVIIYIRNS